MRKAHLGKKHSEETKKLISFNSRNISDETRKKLGDARRGKKRPRDVVEKIANANRGKKGLSGINSPSYGRKLTEEQKRRIGDLKRGVKYSEETRLKHSIAAKKFWENRKKREHDLCTADG